MRECGKHNFSKVGLGWKGEKPFRDASRARIMAEIEDSLRRLQTDHIDISEDEIRVDVFRSSGPGGQGVNTTDSAVRITHLPTGIVVSCQNERSQIQNRASAMAVLQSKLLERRRQEEAEEMAALRGDGGRAWGTQIRNYVLYPYQNVKDVRTGMETGNAVAVLDGEIDEFIDAEIRWMRQNGR